MRHVTSLMTPGMMTSRTRGLNEILFIGKIDVHHKTQVAIAYGGSG
jgi:hypothetical protein